MRKTRSSGKTSLTAALSTRAVGEVDAEGLLHDDPRPVDQGRRRASVVTTVVAAVGGTLR